MSRRSFHLTGLVFLLTLAAGSAGAGTLLDYDFRDGSGTMVADLSGNGNHGTLVGFANTSAGAGVFDVSEGWVIDGGLSFKDDAVRSYVDTPLPLNALPGDFTVEFEANYAGASDWTPAIGSDATACCLQSFYFGISNNQTNIEIRLQDSGGPIGTHPWMSPPNATKHHLAFVYDSATKNVEVFVDGVSVGSGARSAANMAGVSTKFRIGNTGWSAGEQWEGVIFGVAISDEKLTPNRFVIPNRFRPQASEPDPADGAGGILRTVVLGWTPGESAETHDVYFGINSDDIGNADRANPLGVLVSQGQSEATFDPGTLEFGRTYYWRIDEMSAAPGSTIFKGPVWQFTVEPYSYPLPSTLITATASSAQTGMGPEKTIDGSGLNAGDEHSTEATSMWMSANVQPIWIQYEFDKAYKLDAMQVWNANQLIEPFMGFGAKKVAIEYSVDGAAWTPLDGVPEFAKAAGAATYTSNTTINFGGVLARYVKLTILGNWGGLTPQAGLSEVRFLYVPVSAREPVPASGAADVLPQATLSWRAGREAASHEVFLGTDADNLSSAGTVAEPGYEADLNLGTTYFWKVVEVNDAETPSRWDSEVWTFSTVEALSIDDFEGYDDDYENYNRVFQVWIDGVGYSQPEPGKAGNGSGSLVGTNQAPWVELTNVHSGRQAMPVVYNNAAPVSYSEVERTFADPQDWTRAGVQWLVLYFRGHPDNANGQLYVKINSTKKVYDGDPDALGRPLWTLWAIDLAGVGANLQRVTKLGIGVDGAGAAGIVYIDDIGLYGAVPQGPQDPGTDNLVAYYAMANNALDGSGKGNDGALAGGAKFSEDPYRGAVLELDGVDGAVQVPHSASTGFNDAKNLTVTLWIKPAKLPRASWTTVMAKNRDISANDSYGIWISNSNDWHFRVGTASGNANQPGAPDPTEEWHFVAMTHDADAATLRGYVDGRMIYENRNSSAAPLTATSPLWIGGAQGVVEYFPGLIDEVRIYNRALSESEMTFVGTR